jgi:hypothetical protein
MGTPQTADAALAGPNFNLYLLARTEFCALSLLQARQNWVFDAQRARCENLAGFSDYSQISDAPLIHR